MIGSRTQKSPSNRTSSSRLVFTARAPRGRERRGLSSGEPQRNSTLHIALSFREGDARLLPDSLERHHRPAHIPIVGPRPCPGTPGSTGGSSQSCTSTPAPWGGSGGPSPPLISRTSGLRSLGPCSQLPLWAAAAGLMIPRRERMGSGGRRRNGGGWTSRARRLSRRVVGRRNPQSQSRSCRKVRVCARVCVSSFHPPSPPAPGLLCKTCLSLFVD